MKTGTTFNYDYQYQLELQKNQIYKQWLSFNLPYEYRDDMLQSGRIGLFNALSTYDSTKGAWATWMIMYIRKEMIDYINQSLRVIRIPIHQLNNKHINFNENNPTNINVISLNSPINNEDSNERLIDKIADENSYQLDFKEDSEKIKLLKQFQSQLKDKHKEILQLRFVEEKTFEEIGNQLNITRQAAKDRYDKAIKELQKKFKIK